MLLNELAEMSSKELSTLSKDDEATEEALAASPTMQKGTLMDR